MAFPDGTADFRSDTVSRPTPAMRRAMAEAEVGDDVYGEDPTVRRLEARCAEVTGTEAALFVTSGTLGNQLAIWCLTRPASEVICVEHAHVRNTEHGAGAAIAGVQFRPIDTPNGEITPEQLTAATLPEHHRPRPSLLTWENTHNVSGGTVIPFEVMAETSALAREMGLAVHLDGARLFNAVTASGIGADRWASLVDTVQFCFSKGLGAPVGSVLCGSADLIAEARYRRKLLGGGWRQAGVVAAAALVAFEDRDRLAEDHHRARALARGFADRFPESIDPGTVETNLVIVDAAALPGGAARTIDHLAAAGILVEEYPPGHLRFVTHHDIDDHDIERVLAALGDLS